MDVENTEQSAAAEPVAEAPEAPAEATRDDLIAVAQEAAKAEGTPTEAAPAPPAEAEEPRWERLMREREKAQAEREKARNETESLRQRAEAEAKAIVEAAKKQAQEEVEAERARWKNRFQTDPEGALQELGDGEAVASKIIDLNTPHGKAIAKLQAELAEAKKAGGEAKSVREEFEQFRRQQQQSAEQQRYESAKNAFFSEHATAEKTPHFRALYDATEQEARAAKVAKDWSEANLQFDLKDIAQYLEADAKKRFDALGRPAQQSGAGASERTPGVAPKSAANGSRTITAASASERRASPKPFHEMSPAEQREDLIRVAREAFRSHGKP